MRSRKGSGLIITILLTLVVMSMGIYTLSKVKPFAENIVGLEHSVQARYHARSGEEIAKLIYYRNLEDANSQLSNLQGLTEAELAAMPEAEKQKAFCRADDALLLNNRAQRQAISACMTERGQNGATPEEVRQICQEESAYSPFLQPGASTHSRIAVGCDGGSTDGAQVISDLTGGVDTSISTLTSRIPQPCQGESDLVYSTDGNCQNWNRLVEGTPVRINLSNIEGLALENTSGGSLTQNGLSIKFRLPNIDKTADEVLYITADNTNDPMVLWNVYDNQHAFFPDSSSSAIPRNEVFTKNAENNGQSLDALSPGLSLGSTTYKGIWSDPQICQRAATGIPSAEQLTQAEVQALVNPLTAQTKSLITYPDGSCQMSLMAFFQYGLDSCQNRQCFLELNLISALELAGASPLQPHPAGLTAPYLEYQIEIGKSGGASSGDTLEANDPRPVITSIGESGNYSVREESTIEEQLLIPNVSSPIGR